MYITGPVFSKTSGTEKAFNTTTKGRKKKKQLKGGKDIQCLSMVWSQLPGRGNEHTCISRFDSYGRRESDLFISLGNIQIPDNMQTF